MGQKADLWHNKTYEILELCLLILSVTINHLVTYWDLLEGSSKLLTNGIFCAKSKQLFVHVSQGNVMILSHNYNPMERWETTAETESAVFQYTSLLKW